MFLQPKNAIVAPHEVLVDGMLHIQLFVDEFESEGELAYSVF